MIRILALIAIATLLAACLHRGANASDVPAPQACYQLFIPTNGGERLLINRCTGQIWQQMRSLTGGPGQVGVDACRAEIAAGAQECAQGWVWLPWPPAPDASPKKSP